MARFSARILGCTILFVLAFSSVPVRGDDDTEPAVDGKKASEWVDTLINDTSARKRALAVDALAKLWMQKQYKDAIPNIGRALRVDSSAAVRTQAAVALGNLRDVDSSRAEKDLIDAMGTEKESRVRKEIARAIARYKEFPNHAVVQLTQALKDPDAGTRAVIAETLAIAGSDAKSAAAELAPLLDDQDAGARRAAIVALGRITPEGASAIAEKMAKMLGKEKELEMKVELVTSLHLLGVKSPAVVDALAGLLPANVDEELRRRAARALGTFGTSAAPAAEALLKVAASDKAKDIRVDAIHAFGSALGPEMLKKRVNEMIALLSDPEFEVRLAVVNEIGAIGPDLKDDTATMKVLRTRLSDPHPKVREAVRAAMERIEKKPEPKKEPEPKKGP